MSTVQRISIHQLSHALLQTPKQRHNFTASARFPSLSATAAHVQQRRVPRPSITVRLAQLRMLIKTGKWPFGPADKARSVSAAFWDWLALSPKSCWGTLNGAGCGDGAGFSGWHTGLLWKCFVRCKLRTFYGFLFKYFAAVDIFRWSKHKYLNISWDYTQKQQTLQNMWGWQSMIYMGICGVDMDSSLFTSVVMML